MYEDINLMDVVFMYSQNITHGSLKAGNSNKNIFLNMNRSMI